jgi:hypothetical protein
MSNDETIIRAQRKRLAAKMAYAKCKAEREHALLRLRPGSLAKIDHARENMGLTRSAYIESLLEAVGVASTTPCAASKTASPPTVGDEFDALFGSGD